MKTLRANPKTGKKVWRTITPELARSGARVEKVRGAHVPPSPVKPENDEAGELEGDDQPTVPRSRHVVGSLLQTDVVEK
jgi:hypothetical protein